MSLNKLLKINKVYEKQQYFNATDFNFVKKIKANDYIPTDYQKKYLLAIIQKAKERDF